MGQKADIDLVDLQTQRNQRNLVLNKIKIYAIWIFWIVFVATCPSLWFVSQYAEAIGWNLHNYLLIGLRLANFILGIWLLILVWRKPLPRYLAIAGMVVGQLWLIELILVMIIWSIRGFAP